MQGDAEKVVRLGLVRDPDMLLFVKQGQVYRVARRGGPAPELVVDTRVSHDPDFVYFVDQDGDLARARRVLAEPAIRRIRSVLRPRRPSGRLSVR